MPQKSNSSNVRLRDSKAIQLVAELLRRGARTRTVERLTGLSETPIRDVYREIFRSSPTKGPSGGKADKFIETHTVQFQSSLVRVCINSTFEAQNTKTLPPVPELGYFYCKAYDLYLEHLAPLKELMEPFDFEAFAQLALLLSHRSVLSARVCVRCHTPFVSSSSPSALSSRHCPCCRILSTRGCAKCTKYVPLDTGDLQPRRRPNCPAHARRVPMPIATSSAYNRPQYSANSAEQDELVSEQQAA